MLDKKNFRLTEIARKLSATDPEVSRNLSRLSQAGLVEKTVDGSYSLTSLGRLTSSILPSFRVLANRKDYFQSHDLSLLPPVFLQRIGDLVENRYLDHLDAILGLIEEVTRGATEYVWIMTDRPVRLEHKHSRPESLSVHCIVPMSFDVDVVSLLKKNWPGARIRLSYLEPVPVALVLNEHLALVMFPGLDRRIDLTKGLAGTSIPFLTWCRDVFNHLETRAERGPI